MLLEKPGEVVTRDELRSELWCADTFVDFDVGLNTAVLILRNALGGSADSPRFIETLPRRGYRFAARVDGPVPATLHESTRSPTAGHQQEAIASPANATAEAVVPSLERPPPRKFWTAATLLAALLPFIPAFTSPRIRRPSFCS